mgnify:CR=1 FL=1
MRIVRWALLAAVFVVAACSDQSPTPVTPDIQSRERIAPLLSPSGASLIPDRYIVVLNPSATQSATTAASIVPSGQGTVLDTYEDALKGFTADLTPTGLAAVRASSEVSFVEADQQVSINITQTGATWGLDRIDQTSLPLSTTYTYNGNGSGVNAYIIDTGIRLTHTQYAGRAFSGYTAINDGQGTNDCNGHGTHVAGTVGGTTYGVAKGVKLYAVRVLDCAGSGTTSGVIAGINWVAGNKIKPAVANMSLGGGYSASLNTAVSNAVNAGITFVVAAGNSNANACNYSPSSTPSAITVGSSVSNDSRSSFSNLGTCLDIFAPGSSITSSVSTSDVATAVYSGTSMASPHVAGAAALYLQVNPTATPAQVTTALTSNSTLNKITNAGTGSVNRLLNISFIGGVQQPAAPVALFTYTCDVQRRCVFDASTSTGTALKYAWRNTHDRPASGVTAVYWWDRPGIAKTITLTVTDNIGRTSTIAKTITIN